MFCRCKAVCTFALSKPFRYRRHFLFVAQDILFDARLHRVKKFVLHTNLPGHYNFNMCVLGFSLFVKIWLKLYPPKKLRNRINLNY